MCICRNFPKAKLEKILRDGGGGSSVDFLCKINGTELEKIKAAWISLSLKSDDEHWFGVGVDTMCKRFEATNEPTLVSGFCIEPDSALKKTLQLKINLFMMVRLIEKHFMLSQWKTIRHLCAFFLCSAWPEKR